MTDWMTRMVTRLRLLLPPIEDVLAVAGSASVVYGVHMVSVPASYIVGGILLVVVAYLVGRDRS